MNLALIDWVIIVGYFAVTILIGFAFARRAGKSLSEFFVSGRSLPWWIAGTSMVATTFAADTPLAVTGLMVKNGLAGNWFWWAFAFGGMFTVFVYARLWRRAGVMTDVELIRIRYGGKPAKALRYLRAFYVALIVNPIIIGWVIGAMLTVFKETVFFDSPAAGPDSPFWNQMTLPWAAIIGMMLVVAVYSTLSGMWGVAITDIIQFCIAMAGCIWLAIVAVNHVGGIDALRANVDANFGSSQAFDFLPKLSSSEALTPSDNADESIQNARELLQNQLSEVSPEISQAIQTRIDNVELAQSQGEEGLGESVAKLNAAVKKATPGPWMLFHIFLIMLTMQWWATWYPGSEPGGGGYVVQRMASCKDERHSILATLWYQVGHYCVRPWPWIMISFVALAMYPELRANYIADDSFKPEVGFPMVMRELCGPGLAGLMLVAFFAAFMSTISTQMNWGASYLVRDFVQPIFLPNADDRKLANVSRVVSVGMLLVGLVFGWLMQDVSVDDAWKMLAALGAGTGLVFMLRWFWWRISAWSEIVAMIASLTFFLALESNSVQAVFFGDYTLRSEEQMAIVALLTIVTWLIVTFMTRESDETLKGFYQLIRPGGPGWKPIAEQMPEIQQDKVLGVSILGAVLGAGIVFSVLPAIGHFIFGRTTAGITCVIVAAFCAGGVRIVLGRITGESEDAGGA